MKMVDAHEPYMTNFIVEQLNKNEFYDTEGKTQRELITILGTIRVMGKDVDND